jgi:hypothetical protein
VHGVGNGCRRSDDADLADALAADRAELVVGLGQHGDVDVTGIGV